AYLPPAMCASAPSSACRRRSARERWSSSTCTSISRSSNRLRSSHRYGSLSTMHRLCYHLPLRCPATRGDTTMRLAVLSDIHGNLIALEAALADLARVGAVDKLWVLGDLAAIGPRPGDCLQRVRQLVDDFGKDNVSLL